MPTTVLTSNWAEYFSGPWIAYNNVWGAGGLVNGVDFTQTITIDEATFPDGTVLSWSWPSAYKYYAYPEIIYGSAPGLINPDGPQSAQTADFTSLSTSYSITLSGNTNNYDVIFDLWFTPTKNGAQDTADYELMVVAYAPPGWGPGSYEKAAYTLTDSTVTDASVYLNSKSSGGDTWTAITVMLPSNMLSGTISISDIIKSLIWNGVITGQDYLPGVQFGAEPQGGSGSVLINTLSYNWAANPTVTLAAGDNTYSIATPGGNNIFGNGGTDTVVYQGAYSQYQIKQSGTETLVQESGNSSTLDVLTGIAFVQFSNGTYDVATSTFASDATPTVSSLVESPSSGDLDAGKMITLTLGMSENVTVNTTGGSPTLTLNDGGTATYVSGSGSNALVFSYTVLAGQNTPDLTVSAVNLNGATVQDGAGNAANLSLSGLTQGSPQIDTTTPTVSSLVESPSSGDLDAGNTVTLTLSLSEAVMVAGGTPTLTLNDGGTATYTGGSGTNALTFSYTVAAGQNTHEPCGDGGQS